MTRKLDDFVTEAQFTNDAVSRTKKILEIVVGSVDQAMLEKARDGKATEEEMAHVCAGMFAGQAALFQALHTNVATLAKHGLIDMQTGLQICATIKALSTATMAGIVTKHSTTGSSSKTAEIIPFPGSQKVH